MRLVVKDDEAEHAANIVKLAEIRDAAVDLLAVRMTTRAFETAPRSQIITVPPPYSPSGMVPSKSAYSSG
jgi:hypothetical protein